MEIISPPTPSLLARLFGFPVPSPFVRLMSAFWELSQESGEPVSTLVDEVCGFYLEGYDGRYQQTPPELFPIGSPGVTFGPAGTGSFPLVSLTMVRIFFAVSRSRPK